MNKKLIRLTEADLHRIVKESVNRILRESTKPNRRGRRRMNEGGHISYQDEDGTIHTNSKDTYRGVPSSKFKWSAPEILWHGKLIICNEFEDNLWVVFNSETGEDSVKAIEQWIEQQGGTRFLATELDDYLMYLNN